MSVALWPLARLWSAGAQARVALYEGGFLRRYQLGRPVVSVGNLTVGGTGKTPMVMWLAEKFLAEGKRVAILSRGYRGTNGTSDEIELMRSRLQGRVSFGVGKNRFAEGRRLESQHPIDIFLLDDGFQHVRLARDLDIVMLDGSRKLKEQWLLPAGMLREPISACRRADIFVVTRKTERPDIVAGDAHKFLIFYAQTRLLGFRRHGADSSLQYVSELGPGPFYAFCGVGNPEAFFADLSRWRVMVAGKSIFRDHHRYTTADLRGLQQAAEKAGAVGFITTEKDAANLQLEIAGPLPVYIAVIDFVLSAKSEFEAAVDRKLALPRGAAA